MSIVGYKRPHLNAGDAVVGCKRPHLSAGEVVVGCKRPHLSAGEVVVGCKRPHLSAGDLKKSLDGWTFSETKIKTKLKTIKTRIWEIQKHS